MAYSAPSGQKSPRNPSFEEFRQLHFDELKQNASALFNFFYENNDIFNMIDKEDEKILEQKHIDYLDSTFNWTIGTFCSVLFVDHVVFRYAWPQFKIKNFRLPLQIFKYIGLPLISFQIARNMIVPDVEDTYMKMAEKYSFNFMDYNRAMDLLERAERVGKLNELMEKGEKFDWKGIPEFKSKLSSQNK